MSKIGKQLVLLPNVVDIQTQDQRITIKGPKGELSINIHPAVSFVLEDSSLAFSIIDSKNSNLRGLTRALVYNMVVGVTEGYMKKLKIIGVGFDAQVKGKVIVFKVGFSHNVEFPIPEGIDVVSEKDPKGNIIVSISGIDKQLVGQVAAQIRKIKPPEPYKGKGIRYIDEVVKMKEGKTAAKS